MVAGGAYRLDGLFYFRHGGHRVSWHKLTAANAIECRLSDQVPGKLHTVNKFLHILFSPKKARSDPRLIEWIGRSQLNGAAGVRVQVVDIDLKTRYRTLAARKNFLPDVIANSIKETVAVIATISALFHQHRSDIKLQFWRVWVFLFGEQNAAPEGARARSTGGQQIAQAERERAIDALVPGERPVRIFQPKVHRHIDVIFQVFADAGYVCDHLDAVLTQFFARTNAGPAFGACPFLGCRVYSSLVPHRDRDVQPHMRRKRHSSGRYLLLVY